MASTGLVYDPDASHPGLEDDTTHPKLAYPASKIAAENELRNSGLNWNILRLPFVYGDGDEHMAVIPGFVASLKWHPAKTFKRAAQSKVVKMMVPSERTTVARLGTTDSTKQAQTAG